MFHMDVKTTDQQMLFSLGTWGGLALTALVVAAAVGMSQAGAPPVAPGAQPAKPTAVAANLDREMRSLGEAMQRLMVDNDRLAARLGQTETALEAVKASAAQVRAEQDRSIRQAAQARTYNPVQLPPSPFAVVNVPLAPFPAGDELTTGSIAPKSEAAASSTAAQTSFGIDLGSGPTIQSLRGAWYRIRNPRAALFAGLHPVVSIRSEKPGVIELRLIAGPFANAAAAAKLCASLGIMPCEPTIFDGQRLTQR
ncbi:MAG: hypothetical protein AB7K04_15340 [Pseudorhodoplanes sp.]